MIGCFRTLASFANNCSRRSAGLLENSKTKSVLRKSKTKLWGNRSFKYVDFPLFLGPQRNADCFGGRSSSSILRIVSILGLNSLMVELFRSLVRFGTPVKSVIPAVVLF